jgi:8-oxo-dGTP pyrophosphatase MutT (NUDIX family)
MNKFEELAIDLRHKLRMQPGPFKVVEGEGWDNPWRWEVHSTHQPIAVGLFEEIAKALAAILNLADSRPNSVVALIEDEHQHVLAVSRKGEPDNLGLPGGKIEPQDCGSTWQSPIMAVCREVLEEVGLLVDPQDVEFIYERVDPASDSVAWCYRIKKWKGTPKAAEPKTWVGWVMPVRLFYPECVFREYNRSLFRHLGLVLE